jgi:hypothetical protein
VPLARDLHPEFGYIGSGPRMWRKVGLVLVFIVIGLVAAASGVNFFVTSPEPDPMQAMALAPTEALMRVPVAPVENEPPVIKAARMRPAPCREGAVENLGADCTPAKASKPIPAANERPAIAAVAIGHPDESGLLPSQSNIPETAALPEDPAASAETAPVPALTKPPSAAKRTRPRTQHVQQRREALPSRSSHYQDGYARIW